VRLSSVLGEQNQTASELMGACMQGQQATLNGFVCGRSTDVNGINLDKCGRLLVVWPAQINGGATYVSTQVGGPTVLRCSRAASSGSSPTTGGSDSTGGGSGGGGGQPSTSARSLPNTGSAPSVAVAGLVLLAAAGGMWAWRRRVL
jgi:LPXTG-motif cell wall-anchored protein